MVERDQIRPLAPATDHPTSDEEETANHRNKKNLRRKNCIQIFVYIAALLLTLAIIIIILVFTVFKIKNPVINLNRIAVNQLNLSLTNPAGPASNMSLTAEVSVKNPNFASFKYRNTTTTLYYRGTVVIGEARGPGGRTLPNPPPNYLTNVGLGYAIAIALGFLVLLSTLLLASYICCRLTRRRQNPNPNSSGSAASSDNGIILPRIIFVAEDDEDDSQNVVVGLDQAVINTYPKFPFSKGVRNDSVCAICLCDYKDAEMLRTLPDCRHYFHLTCIDAWLKLNASCPVCRNSPLPTPMSTPLSEVVPLSQYSDGRNRRR